MNAYTCPFCGKTMALSVTEEQRWFLPPVPMENLQTGQMYELYEVRTNSDQVCTTLRTCALCHQTSVTVDRDTGAKPFDVRAYPPIQMPDLPDYIPLAIRMDYSEALAVAPISPKAAATLCRRCLQTMIHDRWNIHEKNLNAEITSLKCRIPENLWNAIDALRGLGNIGAHMEHDVNLMIEISHTDAARLVRLIKLLLSKWYIEEHEQSELISQILDTHARVQNARDL